MLCPIPLKSTQTSLHFLTPLIRYNLKQKQKQKQKYFEKTSKKLILDQKKTLLTHFEHDVNFPVNQKKSLLPTP